MSKRRKSSYLWEYFSITDDDSKIAQCDICDRQLCYKSTVNNLRKHLDRKHPTLNLSSHSAAAVTSAVSSVVCDDTDNANGQDSQQPRYSSTHIVDYKPHHPVTYSARIRTVKDIKNELEDNSSVLEVADNIRISQVRTLPSSVGSKRVWKEPKNNEQLIMPLKEISLPIKDTTNESTASGSILGGVADNGTMHQASTPPAALSSVGNKRTWQESMNDELLVLPRKQHSSPTKDDEYELFGMHIAAKMRKISEVNNVQRIIAEKLISEVIFHGQLQSLTVDTVIKVPEKD